MLILFTFIRIHEAGINVRLTPQTLTLLIRAATDIPRIHYDGITTANTYIGHPTPRGGRVLCDNNFAAEKVTNHVEGDNVRPWSGPGSSWGVAGTSWWQTEKRTQIQRCMCEAIRFIGTKKDGIVLCKACTWPAGRPMGERAARTCHGQLLSLATRDLGEGPDWQRGVTWPFIGIQHPRSILALFTQAPGATPRFEI